MAEPDLDRFWRSLEDHAKSDAENFGKIRDHQDRTSIAVATLTVRMSVMWGVFLAFQTGIIGLLLSLLFRNGGLNK